MKLENLEEKVGFVHYLNTSAGGNFMKTLLTIVILFLSVAVFGQTKTLNNCD